MSESEPIRRLPRSGSEGFARAGPSRRIGRFHGGSSMRRSFVLLAASFMALAACDKKSADLRCPAPVTTKFDSDGDLLTDVQELSLGTNPRAKDSDGDGFSDYAEVAAGTDPLTASSKPSGVVSSVVQISDAAQLIGGP